MEDSVTECSVSPEPSTLPNTKMTAEQIDNKPDVEMREDASQASSASDTSTGTGSEVESDASSDAAKGVTSQTRPISSSHKEPKIGSKEDLGVGSVENPGGVFDIGSVANKGVNSISNSKLATNPDTTSGSASESIVKESSKSAIVKNDIQQVQGSEDAKKTNNQTQAVSCSDPDLVTKVLQQLNVPPQPHLDSMSEKKSRVTSEPQSALQSCSQTQHDSSHKENKEVKPLSQTDQELQPESEPNVTGSLKFRAQSKPHVEPASRLTSEPVQQIPRRDQPIPIVPSSGRIAPKISDDEAVINTPLFAENVLEEARLGSFKQYGLFCDVLSKSHCHYDTDKSNPLRNGSKVFLNVNTPQSAFICGSQGSGKSYTLSCMLEKCLLPSASTILPKPLAAIVFHYDTFTSFGSNQVCEAAYLCSHDIPVKVLVSPSNYWYMKQAYESILLKSSSLRKPKVIPMQLQDEQLNVSRIKELMAISDREGSMPLYMEV